MPGCQQMGTDQRVPAPHRAASLPGFRSVLSWIFFDGPKRRYQDSACDTGQKSHCTTRECSNFFHFGRHHVNCAVCRAAQMETQVYGCGGLPWRSSISVDRPRRLIEFLGESLCPVMAFCDVHQPGPRRVIGQRPEPVELHESTDPGANAGKPGPRFCTRNRTKETLKAASQWMHKNEK